MIKLLISSEPGGGCTRNYEILSFDRWLIMAKLNSDIIARIIFFKNIFYLTKKIFINIISYLFLTITFIISPFCSARVFADCVYGTVVDVNIEAIISDLPNTSNIDNISNLIAHINTKKPLFCEQDRIKSSGLVSSIYIRDFFRKKIITYEMVGKKAILALEFDYNSGNFLPEYSAVRTKKTVLDYQLAPLRR